MSNRRLIWLLLFIMGSAVPGIQPALAQPSKVGLTPENQQKYDEAIKAAKQAHGQAEIGIMIATAGLVLALLAGAFSVLKYGFKISESKRLEGRGAQVIAAMLVLLAIGTLAGSWWFFFRTPMPNL